MSFAAHSQLKFLQRKGFTLVEILVSVAVLAVLVVVLASIVSRTSAIWNYTSSRVEQFRSAREGFDAITSRLSKATLNTYWDYDDPNQPTKYLRQSDLRFISGPRIAPGSGSQDRPTHGVFFFAPFGFETPQNGNDTSSKQFEGLDATLNAWGYFIEYGDDNATKPEFIKSAPRQRFRLMEFMQPSHALSLYSLEKQAGGNQSYTDADWFLNAINDTSSTRPVHVLAENVIALVLLPKLSSSDQTAGGYSSASLAPNYRYDTTGKGMSTLSDSKLNPRHQLPPIVRVIMVAIDETSAKRMSSQDVSDLRSKLDSLFANPSQLESDLGSNQASASSSLAAFLKNKRINYRIFTTDVSIKGAKWSTEQGN